MARDRPEADQGPPCKRSGSLSSALGSGLGRNLGRGLRSGLGRGVDRRSRVDNRGAAVDRGARSRSARHLGLAVALQTPEEAVMTAAGAAGLLGLGRAGLAHRGRRRAGHVANRGRRAGLAANRSRGALGLVQLQVASTGVSRRERQAQEAQQSHDREVSSHGVFSLEYGKLPKTGQIRPQSES